jgi:hypothetical protein
MENPRDRMIVGIDSITQRLGYCKKVLVSRADEQKRSSKSLERPFNSNAIVSTAEARIKRSQFTDFDPGCVCARACNLSGSLRRSTWWVAFLCGTLAR